MVLGLLLSGCGDGTYTEIIGGKNIKITTSQTEVEMWQNYKNVNATYKLYGRIYDWKSSNYTFGTKYSHSDLSFEEALKVFFESKSCSKGCWVTHVGLEKISEEKQKEYAEKYLPPGIVGKIFRSTEKVAKKQKPKSTPDDDKVVPAGSGSGFFVSNDGHIITNHHVIDGCNTTKVHFNGNQLDTQILAADKMNDIAILKTNIKPNNIFPVSNEDVSLLEDTIVAGYPLGKKVSSAIKTHKGIVTALAGAGDNFSNFQTDASINPGNSGGPIMNQKGNIVGIAVATWVEDGVQGVHFGIKSSTLKTFANSNSLAFKQPNNRDLSNKDLGKLITEATVYLECHMTIANIKKMIAATNNRKAFFSEHIN